jgi:hypothetical protein
MELDNTAAMNGAQLLESRYKGQLALILPSN